MKSARLSIVGVALATVAALGACGSGDDSTTTGTTTGTDTGSSAAATTDAAPAPAGALGELVAAAEKTTSTTAKVAMKSGGSVTIAGAFDAPGELVKLDSDFGSAGTIKVLRVGNDLYLKAGGGVARAYSGNGKKWLHVDASKQTGTLSIEQNDPSSTAKLLASGAADVTGSGGTYKGTIDMSKSPTVASTIGAAAGEKFKAIPFTAEVADGYLTKVTLDMSGVAKGAGKSVTAYSGFGEPVDVQKPAAGETIEMSAADIKKMGG